MDKKEAYEIMKDRLNNTVYYLNKSLDNIDNIIEKHRTKFIINNEAAKIVFLNSFCNDIINLKSTINDKVLVSIENEIVQINSEIPDV